MEAIPFILFIFIWIFTYKYFLKKRGKILSHIFSLFFSCIGLFVSAAIVLPPPTPEQIKEREFKDLQEKEKDLQEKKEKELKEQDKKLFEQKQKDLEEIEKQKKIIEQKEKQELKDLKNIEDDMDIPLRKATQLSLEDLNKLSLRYVSANKIDLKYSDKIYDCISQYIWEKEKTLSLLSISKWCIDETKRSDYDKINHINIASFMIDIDPWNLSYEPFNKIIKYMMHNPNSFEHVETLKNYVSNTENPYMFIKTTIRGTNVYNAIVTNTFSAKVDAKTKKIYDVLKY